MALKGVSQESTTGCFIACVAMLLGKTYSEAFALCHPGIDKSMAFTHGFSNQSVINAAMTALNRAGINGHVAKARLFSSYKRQNKHALLIIRWTVMPTMCHTIVYDASARGFIDPSGGRPPTKYHLRDLQRQFEVGIIIDEIPKDKNATQKRIGLGI